MKITIQAFFLLLAFIFFLLAAFPAFNTARVNWTALGYAAVVAAFLFD